MAPRRFALLAAVAVGLAGCSYSDSGGGSETLAVVASASHDGNNGRTALSVRIEDEDGQRVTNATVTFTDDDTAEAFDLQINPGGRYVATAEGYRRHLRLSVERNEDELTGAIEGPAPHRITKPANTRSRAVTKDLRVEWATEDGVRADQVVIGFDLTGFDTVLTDDQGYYEIPQSSLEVGTGALTVERRNAVVLNGGLRESSLTLGTSVDHDVTVEDR